MANGSTIYLRFALPGNSQRALDSDPLKAPHVINAEKKSPYRCDHRRY